MLKDELKDKPRVEHKARLEIAEALHSGVAVEIEEIGNNLAELIGRRTLTPALRNQLRALLAKNTALSVRMREEILQLRGLDQQKVAQLKKARELTPLTKKESEILHQLNKALTSKEIAAAQFLSQATVKSHLAAIYRKLGVTNKTAALDAARNAGLLSLK